jgi:hypothetical protein
MLWMGVDVVDGCSCSASKLDDDGTFKNVQT